MLKPLKANITSVMYGVRVNDFRPDASEGIIGLEGDTSMIATSVFTRIAVIDELLFSKMILSKYLRDQQCEVVEVSEISELSACDSLDALMVDISAVNGETPESLRERVGNENLPLIGVCNTDEVDDMREIGFEDVLPRPYNSVMLVQWLMSNELIETAEMRSYFDEALRDDMTNLLGPEQYVEAVKTYYYELAEGAPLITLADFSDPDTISTVHKLSGGAAVLGLAFAHEHLKAAELACKMGRQRDYAKHIDVLMSQFVEMRAEMVVYCEKILLQSEA